jgi:hypothetical protein
MTRAGGRTIAQWAWEMRIIELVLEVSENILADQRLCLPS